MSGTRVVICTASVGHGHTGAAMAIAAAIRQMEPDAAVEVIDAMTGAPGWFTRIYRDGYLTAISKLPWLAGWMYDAADKVEPADPQQRALSSRMAFALEHSAMRNFVAHRAFETADLVICTHFLCARVLSDRKLAGQLSAPLVVSVTDQHPHGVWLVQGAERILLASEEARIAAVAAGIPADRLEVTGIAVSRRFFELPPKAQARAMLGLPQDRGIVLMSGGGLGMSSMEAAMQSVLERESSVPLHVVAVCGRNERLKARLDEVAARDHGPARSCTILGFTDQMHLLMAASDVKVGKPGGMTTAEAACAGLPMVLLKPIPGQEERNANRLVRLGAAVLEHDPHVAMQIAADIATDPARIQAMKAGAAAFSRGEANSQASQGCSRGATAAAESSLALIRSHEAADELLPCEVA